MLSSLSVNIQPDSRLRHWCSTQYLRISPLHWVFHYPLCNSSHIVIMAIPKLSSGISPLSYITAYTPFTPSNSEQRLPPSYYRGCWHEVSRGFFRCYRHHRHTRKSFTIRKPSSLTRHGWVRVASIAQYSSLLPPVGVWTVSQFQCGGPSSQNPYPSWSWWAVTPPTN